MRVLKMMVVCFYPIFFMGCTLIKTGGFGEKRKEKISESVNKEIRQ